MQPKRESKEGGIRGENNNWQLVFQLNELLRTFVESLMSFKDLVCSCSRHVHDRQSLCVSLFPQSCEQQGIRD